MASNIGEIVATATLDVAPFQSNVGRLKTYLKGVDNSLKAMENNFKGAGKNVSNLKSLLSQTGSALGSYQKLLSSQSERYNQLKASIGDVSTATAEQKQKLVEAGASMTATAAKVAELQNRYEQLAKSMRQAYIDDSAFTKFGKSAQEIGNKISQAGQIVSGFGSALTRGVTAPIVAGAGIVLKAAIDYESAFAGVKKTVDETATVSYQKLSDGIRQMAKELPASAVEIANVAEVAGQLGIKTEDILSFSRTMIDMGESTNLSAEEAATAIAKIANIMGLTSDEYSRFGAAVVDLGNNFATTEKDIVEMTNRLAAGGKLAGLSTADILGLATAMSSVGIEAEAGGTAMTQTLTAIGHVAFRKVELTRSSTRIDAGPAPEDGKTDLIAAKANFEKTAEGISAKISAIEYYVGQDGQRQETLQRYTREESAKQAAAVRELVAKDYVGKATYQEDVRGLERKFEAITNPKNGLIATQIATYKNAVDGRFTEITSLISGKANQTDFQRVKETSQLYERILGNSENGIADKVARMAMTNQLFQVEVSKNEGLKTVQRQLAGSWGVHNKNSVNEIIAGFNLAGRNAGIKAETIRLEGNTLADKLTAIDGYFKRLFVGEGTFATLNTDVIRTNSITADKLVFNEALANRMVSNEIITSKLVASRAFVNALKAITIDASQIVTGTLKGDRIYGGTIRGTEINGTTITGNSRMTIGDNGFLRPTQEGGLQINVPETYSASKGVGVQLLGRELGRIPKGMFIYNSPNWNGGNIIGDNTEDILLTVKGRVSLCNLHNGSPVSGVPIISNFEYQNPIRNLYPIRFIGWDPRSNQLYVDDGTGKSGTWWISVDGSTSDKNLKTNIGDTHYNALDFVQKLMFKEFDWKTDKFGYKKPYTNVGLIAQDVEKIDSSLVYKKGETLALDDFRLLNIALKAIQELALENRKLTHRLENLENERRTA